MKCHDEMIKMLCHMMKMLYTVIAQHAQHAQQQSVRAAWSGENIRHHMIK
jgi:hypothetical protein